jgi:hypothetical protein
MECVRNNMQVEVCSAEYTVHDMQRTRVMQKLVLKIHYFYIMLSGAEIILLHFLALYFLYIERIIIVYIVKFLL